VNESGLIAVAVIGADRPGIVVGVTKVLFERGCNLEDATCTILRDHFAMMLLVSSTDVSAAQLEEALQPVAQRLDLVTTARAISREAVDIPAPTHTLSVYGSDKPGIVYRFADALTELDVNIVDLTSRVIGEPERPLYMLVLDVAVPEDTDLRKALDGLRREVDVEVTVHAIQADVL
jgi:glycine cleavage system transcriptional repressor